MFVRNDGWAMTRVGPHWVIRVVSSCPRHVRLSPETHRESRCGGLAASGQQRTLALHKKLGVPSPAVACIDHLFCLELLALGMPATDFLTSRAHSMKRSTAGFNVRFFSVTIAYDMCA